MEFSYNIAGIQVLTNRKILAVEEKTLSDTSVRVIFSDRMIEKSSNIIVSIPEYFDHGYLLTDETSLPTYISADGKVVLIFESKSLDVDYAGEVRRAIPFASVLQGKVILHAASIEYEGKALAFIAASGIGKSTLAKHLNILGFRILSDDLLPCSIKDETVVVLGSQNQGFPSYLPLGLVYFLSRDNGLSRPCCYSLTRKKCLELLIYNGFGEMAVPQAWKLQFSLYHHIAQQTLAFSLQIPNNISKISEIAEDLANNFFPVHISKSNI